MADKQGTIDAIYQLLTGGAVPGAATRTVGGLGYRIGRAAAADPQNVWQNLFTIAGGVIAITGLVGVRTVIQAGGASTMQFRHSVGPTVLDAGTAAITGDAIGTIYVLTGDTTDPIQVGAAGVAVMGGKIVATSTTYGCVPLFIVGAGTIDVTMTAAAGTGSTRYILTYIPLDDAVTVV
jgi:hypothetical protein